MKTMLLTNTQTDPIVEILRLAYRRGLAIRENQAELNQTIESVNIDKKTETIDRQSLVDKMESNNEQ